MSIPTYTTIIEQLFTELDLLLNHFVYDGYQALANVLRVPLGLAATLHITLTGVSMSQGWVRFSWDDFVKLVVKIGVIFTFALQWAVFSQYAVQLLQGAAGELGSVLVNATPIALPHFAGEGINGALQTVLIEITKIGAWVWDKGGLSNLSPFFTASMIWGFGYAILTVAIFEMVLAKIMLAILFASAPLFVSFTLFNVTRGFFDRWLGACVGFSLLMIFVSTILGLALSLVQWSIGGLYLDHALNISLVGYVPIMIVGFLGVGIILRAAQLAQAIGGTVSTSSGTALLSGAVGGALGASLAGFKSPWRVLGGGHRAYQGLRSAKRAIKDRVSRTIGRGQL